MPTLTIKNVPRDLYKRLKSRAVQNRRSLNGEAIVCLQQVLGSERLDPETFLAQVRGLRRKLTKVFLTDEEIRVARNEGRP